jgi:hypothetical protein
MRPVADETALDREIRIGRPVLSLPSEKERMLDRVASTERLELRIVLQRMDEHVSVYQFLLPGSEGARYAPALAGDLRIGR